MIPKINTIILVIATDANPTYKLFKDIWLQYCNSSPHFKVHFVYGDSLTSTPHPNDIHFPFIKEYANENTTKLEREHSMLEKTIEAFKYIDQRYNYDFVIRTNLTTFWDLDKQHILMRTFPLSKFAIGTMRQIVSTNTSENYISGTDLIITRDLVKNFIIDKPDIMKKPYSEDFSLSHYLRHDRGITLQEFIPKTQAVLEHYTEYNPNTFEQSLERYKNLYITHYRIKSKGNRSNIDIPIANHLLKMIYNKSISLPTNI